MQSHPFSLYWQGAQNQLFGFVLFISCVCILSDGQQQNKFLQKATCSKNYFFALRTEKVC